MKNCSKTSPQQAESRLLSQTHNKVRLSEAKASAAGNDNLNYSFQNESTWQGPPDQPQLLSRIAQLEQLVEVRGP